MMVRSKPQKQTKRNRRRGMLTFEWICLITVLVIGTIGGLAAVRNALISELHDLAAAIHALSNYSPSGPPGDPRDDSFDPPEPPFEPPDDSPPPYDP